MPIIISLNQTAIYILKSLDQTHIILAYLMEEKSEFWLAV